MNRLQLLAMRVKNKLLAGKVRCPGSVILFSWIITNTFTELEKLKKINLHGIKDQ